ncbi:Lrp/AsnC family transcriptional regulator [Pseudomaricurvus alkylphenolicus]|uniref:winged helix-turn-helix transcriptional regulator n=1 Tax=Pseudomaricurvus alkylphenolicus TaxID=1306991 RepID=UPI0014221EFF|nr:Lrp/AsnC family transcriptional regulator [Pseudomaricurvus alkylphenolicus]
MTIKNDEKAILAVLQQDGRLSNVELAKRVHLSESPCLRKTKALEESGIIRGYRAEVDPKLLGCHISAVILVNLDQRSETDTTAFFDAVQSEARIIECLAITGPNDLMLRVVAKDIDDLGDLTMRGILRYPSVKDIASCVVIKEIKPSSPIPALE